MFLPLLAAVALAEPSVEPADSSPEPTLVADWTQPHRWFIEDEVHLPLPMWLAADNNHEGRALAWQLKLVIDCGPGELTTRKAWEVNCPIDAVGLLVAAYGPDRGELNDQVLPEIQDKLEDATVQLQVRADGRVVNVDLDGPPEDNIRMGAISENLRQMVIRSVAGLDLQLPIDGVDQWPQYRGQLIDVPSGQGSSSGMQIVHQRQPMRPDGWVPIHSEGEGTAYLWSDAFQDNAWSTKVSSDAGFDTTVGALAMRRWIVVGDPTPGSAVAEGVSGLPYLQKGKLLLLRDGNTPDVGPTGETELPGVPTDGILPAWQVIGVTPDSGGLPW
jgi:hypothetical protein